jgi:hypothetical protein
VSGTDVPGGPNSTFGNETDDNSTAFSYGTGGAAAAVGAFALLVNVL